MKEEKFPSLFRVIKELLLSEKVFAEIYAVWSTVLVYTSPVTNPVLYTEGNHRSGIRMILTLGLSIAGKSGCPPGIKYQTQRLL